MKVGRPGVRAAINQVEWRSDRSPAGFTLVELLTVIALVALIGGLGAGAYQVARRNYALIASAGRIQGILRAARNSSLSTGNPSYVVIDPVARRVTAQAFERVGEWSFDAPEGDEPLGISVRTDVHHNVTVVPGKVGNGLAFRSGGAHVDCGTAARFDLRTGILIEAWVRHFTVRSARPPLAERKEGGTRRGERRSAAATETAAAIVEKAGAYSLGMTRSGALEGTIGGYSVRTADGVVLPERWVHVGLVYDGVRIELSADGVPRGSAPAAGSALAAGARSAVGTIAASAAPAGPPPAAPVTTTPLTISSGAASFPGEVDEVRLAGAVEPLQYSYPEHEHILGWKKVIHFDRRGRLDPAFHSEPVRIVLIDLPGETGTKAAPRTVPAAPAVVDYTVTFAEWVARWDKDPGLSQIEEERKVEAAHATARKAVISVERLGVIR
ncbi:MAG TPA: prepilin-type N-terminal cleavage/methylation domain-containing protein [Planctomycetota bacterium]|nr:prepilin-type N-terminal cleavage/methylation domain-containing protein [Planctomycetota bacterium]